MIRLYDFLRQPQSNFGKIDRVCRTFTVTGVSAPNIGHRFSPTNKHPESQGYALTPLIIRSITGMGYESVILRIRGSIEAKRTPTNAEVGETWISSLSPGSSKAGKDDKERPRSEGNKGIDASKLEFLESIID